MPSAVAISRDMVFQLQLKLATTIVNFDFAVTRVLRLFPFPQPRSTSLVKPSSARKSPGVPRERENSICVGRHVNLGLLLPVQISTPVSLWAATMRTKSPKY